MCLAPAFALASEKEKKRRYNSVSSCQENGKRGALLQHRYPFLFCAGAKVGARHGTEAAGPKYAQNKPWAGGTSLICVFFSSFGVVLIYG